jgi:unsaturated chondroitin disaccharide hydrolase
MDTCWARGQGWHIAGLSRAYAETGAGRYLDALEAAVEYYLDHTPEDLVPYWDFEDPRIPDVPRDTSAAGIAAYGLSWLDGDDERAERLRGIGRDVLASLVSGYLRTDVDDDRRGMVLQGCYSMPGDYAIDNELIWTDFYVARSLCRYLDAV